MAFFTDEIPVELIPLPEGQWVKARGMLSMGDRQRIQDGVTEISAVMPLDDDGADDNRAARRRRGRTTRKAGHEATPPPQPVLRIHPNNILLMEVALVEWSFPRPINKENIEHLHPEYGELIVDALDELYNPDPLVESPATTTTES